MAAASGCLAARAAGAADAAARQPSAAAPAAAAGDEHAIGQGRAADPQIRRATARTWSGDAGAVRRTGAARSAAVEAVRAADVDADLRARVEGGAGDDRHPATATAPVPVAALGAGDLEGHRHRGRGRGGLTRGHDDHRRQEQSTARALQ